jgi:alkylation response protein AidB-like acyl-CoA dehydrogenase
VKAPRQTAAVADWWRSLSSQTDDLDLSDPQIAAAVLRNAVTSGLLNLPSPGKDTAARWSVLEAVARLDVTLVRLAEGHADALAILAEHSADSGLASEGIWGVWAAAPASLRATCSGDRWEITGDRPWCSGAAVCTAVLVTAQTGDGIGLFAVQTIQQDAVRALPGSWPAVGMSGTDSRTVRFEKAEAVRLGGADAYVNRPGFWHGGAGVAACWYGSAVGVAEDFRAMTRDDPHQLAHLGVVDAALAAGRAVLDAHARSIDADPGDISHTARRRTMQTRAVIEGVAEHVLQHTGRALGATPLCQNRRHARRVADLSVYLRQSHAESDLETLGRLTVNQPAWPWP